MEIHMYSIFIDETVKHCLGFDGEAICQAAEQIISEHTGKKILTIRPLLRFGKFCASWHTPFATTR